jgi:hypothetical protein
VAAFFKDDGSWNNPAWILYWKAMWSAPTQPGYATLVREGLARLTSLADWLIAQGQIYEGAEEAFTEVAQARVQLTTYAAIAAATNDGPTLRDAVVSPMLTSSDSPLYRIGRGFEALIHTSGLPRATLGEVLEQQLVDPLARAARAVASGGFSLLQIVAGALGVLIFIRVLGGGEGAL